LNCVGFMVDSSIIHKTHVSCAVMFYFRLGSDWQ